MTVVFGCHGLHRAGWQYSFFFTISVPEYCFVMKWCRVLYRMPKSLNLLLFQEVKTRGPEQQLLAESC